MLRKCTDEDISDEECKNVIDPFYDNFDEYVVNYIMPEVIAFYIASSFYCYTPPYVLYKIMYIT